MMDNSQDFNNLAHPAVGALHNLFVVLVVLTLLVSFSQLPFVETYRVTSAADPGADWYDCDWSTRKYIEIDATKVSGSSDLTNFPIMVTATSGVVTAAQSDGGDILFTSVDGTTKIDHELESYGVLYDPSTASYDSTLDVEAYEDRAKDVAFNSSGTKLFVVGREDNVVEYSLSTAYDISTASYLDTLDLTSYDTAPTGIGFNPTGTKMYISGDSTDKIFEFTLSTGFDLSTTTGSPTELSVSGQTASPFGADFNSDGTKLYVSDNTGAILEYAMSSAYSLSTATYTDELNVSSQTTSAYSTAFNSDGTVIYVPSWSDATIYKYELSVAYDVSTGTYDSSADISGDISFGLSGIEFNDDGTKLFAVDSTGGVDSVVHEFIIEGFVAWVEVPTLSYSTNTGLYLYYNNDAGSLDEQNATGTWNSDYVGVWHLNEGASTASDFFQDSTSNANHGTLTDSDGDSSSVSGQMGRAVHFSGDADYINVDNQSSLNPTSLTFSAWVSVDTFNKPIAAKPYTSYTTPYFQYGFLSGASSDFHFSSAASGDSTYHSASSGTGKSTGTFYHLAGTYDGETITLYLDGSSVGTDTDPSGNLASYSTDLKLGANKVSPDTYFDGILDEVRVMSDDMTGDWIQTEYNNQDNPSTFYTISDSVGRCGSRRILITQGTLDFKAEDVVALS